MDFKRVIYTAPLVLLSFTLSACGGSSGASDVSDAANVIEAVSQPLTLANNNDPSATQTKVMLSGNITFDRVPTGTTGLDYNAITQSPVRKATVQALSDTDAVLATTVTDDSGDYSVEVALNTLVKIRVKAEMAVYNVTVVDNTNSDALYVLDGSLLSSGTTNSTRDLHASSGWGGSSYTTTRVSAPFAILDSMFIASEKIKAVDANATYAELMVNWSINNIPATDKTIEPDANTAIGQIGTSHYDDGKLFILGKENTDTDEFDDHVMLHEWAHYFEDKFSRSDSIGGRHSDNILLDMRVAFGEGFGNAMSGILTDDPMYKDTTGDQQGRSFKIDVETSTPKNNAGFYSESSVQRILYDLYDANADDANDATALGFAPLYHVLVNGEKDAKAFTSIFTFINALKAANADQASAIDLVVSGENIQVINDDFGSNETDDRNGSLHVLPIYTVLTVGTAVNLCSVDDFGNKNKLANTRFLRFSISTAGSYTMRAVRTTGKDPADIDFGVYQAFPFTQVMKGLTFTSNTEQVTANLAVGDYVMAIWEDDNRRADNGNSTCFDIILGT